MITTHILEGSNVINSVTCVDREMSHEVATVEADPLYFTWRAVDRARSNPQCANAWRGVVDCLPA